MVLWRSEKLVEDAPLLEKSPVQLRMNNMDGWNFYRKIEAARSEGEPSFGRDFGGPDQARHLCVIEPTVPDSIKPLDIHKILFDKLGTDYVTCYRSKSKQIVVQLDSAESVQGYRGQSLEIQNEVYRFEYTNDHSRDFICTDVQGLAVDGILHGLDKYEIAVKEHFAIFRQKHHGPLVALHFSNAQANKFEFMLKVDSVTLSFIRASSQCLLCNRQHNQISECKQMDKVRNAQAPSGCRVQFKGEMEDISKRLKEVLNSESELKLKEEATYAIVEEWTRLKEIMSRIPFQRL